MIMADGRKNNGGNKNAGRKPKAEEQKLIEKLSPLEEKAYIALKNAIEEQESWAVKLFFEYMYGKPKQIVEQKTTHDFNSFDITKLYAGETHEEMG
jgi:uncharacterized MAPEG superfamily protein